MKPSRLIRKTEMRRTGFHRHGPMKRGEVIHKPMPRRIVAVHGVLHYPDGREVCDKSAAGKKEYNRRKEIMWRRQHGICGLKISNLCPVFITLAQATFEHQDGRGLGGSHRDDRVEIDGKPYNMASCGACNIAKGSRRLEDL